MIEEALENVANSAVWLALEEIGVEVVLDNLNFDDLSNFVVAKQLESRNERSFGKESIAEKSENSINFNVSAVNSLSKGDFLCELWHRPDSLYKELNEEICPAEKSVEEVGRVFEDLNTLDAGDAYCSLQKHLRLNQPTKTSERQSVSEKYSSLVELVASFVSGKAITDAAEEILKGNVNTSVLIALVTVLSKAARRQQRVRWLLKLFIIGLVLERNYPIKSQNFMTPSILKHTSTLYLAIIKLIQINTKILNCEVSFVVERKK